MSLNNIMETIKAVSGYVAAFASYLVGWYNGRSKERTKQAEKVLSDVEISSSPVSDADRDKLRDKYIRK